MKISLISAFWAILTFVVLGMSGATVLAAETVRLASGEWAPFQSEQLVHGGVATRIVTEAFAQQGITVEYGYFPWKRSFELAKKGKWDGTFLWFDTVERREFFLVSDPIIDVDYVFFHRRDVAFDWQSVEDLKGFRIGATLGYEFGGYEFKWAEQQGKIKVLRQAGDDKNLNLLLRGRIDLFPCERLACSELIQKTFTAEQSAELTYHPHSIRSDPHHLLMFKSPRNDKLLEEFNKGLEKLRADGRLDKYRSELPVATNQP